MNVFMRFEGYPSKAFIGATINLVSLLAFSFLFIKIFDLGIKGVALGLIISRIITVLYYLWHFISPHKGFGFRFKKENVGGDAKQIFMIGIPNALSEASSGIFILVFNFLAIFWLGNNGLVIFAVISNLFQITVQLMLGVAQGMQPIISWHHAKEEKSLSYMYLRYTLALTAVLSIGFTSIGFLFSEWIAGMYISPNDTVLFSQAVSALKIFSWFALAVGFNIVFISYFSAAEKANWSMILSWGRSLVVICAAGIILPYIMGSDGIWFAPAANELIILALVIYYCAKGRILKELVPIKLKARFA
jgi:Na+-driven multidrug efflux pump